MTSPALRRLHPGRIAALQRTALLDSPTEESFDRLTRLAARVLRAPIALISLIDQDRQFFKSQWGLSEPLASLRQTPLSHSFCQHVIEAEAPLIVEDARLHPVVFDNLAIRDLGVVAYLGVPLVTSHGEALGTLCVKDYAPRRWSDDEVETLRDLARSVVTEIELRLEVAERLSEQALREESEQRYRGLCEASSEAIVLHHQGVILEANPAFAALVGAPVDEIVGHSPMEFVAPRARALVAEQIRTESDTPFQAAVLRRDGRTVEVEVVARAVPLGGFRVRSVAIRDITVQLRAEAALRESEQRYRGLVESASDMIYSADLEGRFTYVNPVATRVMGIPAHLLVGMHFLELIREDAREDAAAHYGAQLRNGTPSTYYEFPAVTALGREVWIGQHVQLTYSDGAPVGVQAVARDISAHHEVERTKDELVSIIHHELRTPLTAMRGALGLLASGRLGTLEEKGQRMLEIAAQNAGYLVELVGNVLDVERIAAGRVHFQQRTVDVATLMEDAVAAARSPAERVGVRLLCAPLFARIMVDPDRVLQALEHLLSNAVKFSPPGGVVWLTARLQANEVIFCVRDEGPGIAEEKQALIFERFRQADSSDTRRKGGTGLGLTICRGIVEQHHGRVWVESRVGEGSRFYIALPLAPDIQPA